MNENWVERKRPIRLERRIEFDDYEQTREFLDQAADLSEAESYYPDLSFSRTHVSVALHVQEGKKKIGKKILRFAELMDAIVPSLHKSDETSEIVGK
ncbi:4a-hydroxytetrahydrobiopterin dehydratase [Gammaproteobacteria bacterium AH-315-C21]|nr:4a-hydroxytetrahydrobiopterin dehydratase [Gammaproteobacteria bacterium AH-315-C21]